MVSPKSYTMNARGPGDRVAADRLGLMSALVQVCWWPLRSSMGVRCHGQM